MNAAGLPVEADDDDPGHRQDEAQKEERADAGPVFQDEPGEQGCQHRHGIQDDAGIGRRGVDHADVLKKEISSDAEKPAEHKQAFLL